MCVAHVSVHWVVRCTVVALYFTTHTLYWLCKFPFVNPIASIGKQNRIHLVDGFTENEGVVEIQHMEMIKNAKVGVAWGTVCVPSHPSRNIGQVACRQLGYEDFGYFLSVGQFTSLNYRRVALKVTKCKGSELSLETCQSMLFPTQLDCSQHQFLAVMCASKGNSHHTITCTPHLVQLPPAYISHCVTFSCMGVHSML